METSVPADDGLCARMLITPIVHLRSFNQDKSKRTENPVSEKTDSAEDEEDEKDFGSGAKPPARFG